MCNVCGIYHGTEPGTMLTSFAATQNIRQVPLENLLGNIARCIFCSLFINILQSFYPHHANLTLPALQDFGIWWMNSEDSQSHGASLAEGIVRLHPNHISFPPEPIIEVYGFQNLVRWPDGKNVTNTVSELPESPDSAATWEFVNSRLDECASQHNNTCSEPELPKLPARIIEITSSDPWAVRLHESDVGDFGRYTTLSYRWGQRVFLKTGPGELESMKANIPWSVMPVLFRDAIQITHRLGLRYVWIDALCIIQRNQSDFNIEAPKMADYYGNSYLTIIADSSSSPYDSILNVSRARWIGQEFQVPNTSNVVKARQTRANMPFSLSSHTMGRAWTWQERVLSRRALHYYERDVAFECRSQREITEDGLLPVEHNSARERYRLGFSPSLDIDWIYGLQSYSQLNYSNPVDRLPAIAGFAKRISLYKRSAYIAGLWEDDFLANLLWWSSWHPRLCFPASKEALIELSRPPQVIGEPSWSWASISGRIMNNAISGPKDSKSNRQDLATILEKDCVIAGPNPDPFGHVLSGYVKMQAPTEQVSLIFNGWNWSLEVNSHKYKARALVDAPLQAGWTTTRNGTRKHATRRKLECPKDRNPPPTNTSVTAVYVLKDLSSRTIYGLLLGTVVEWASMYERIGMFELTVTEAEINSMAFSSTQQETILTII